MARSTSRRSHTDPASNSARVISATRAFISGVTRAFKISVDVMGLSVTNGRYNNILPTKENVPDIPSELLVSLFLETRTGAQIANCVHDLGAAQRDGSPCTRRALSQLHLAPNSAT